MQAPPLFQDILHTSGTVHLRLLETTDVHVHLQPYDYYADCPDTDLGLVQLAGLVDAARAEVANCLLFDNGDFLQGTPMGDYIAYERGLREGDLHPVMAAMNALGFDAIALGNHEFNYGIDFLMKSLSGAACPVVSANLVTALGATPRQDRTLVRPYVLLDRVVRDALGQPQPIRIGVIGLAPPQVLLWEHQHLHGRLKARDMLEAAQAWVPEMREAGADLVLALAHTGIGAAEHSAGMENAARPLARQGGIDALMLGHTHLLFPAPLASGAPTLSGVDHLHGTIEGKPAVMGGFWGAHLGVIDLLLQRDAGRWRILGTRSEVRGLHHASAVGATARKVPESPPLHAAAPAAPPELTPAVTRAGLVQQAVAQAHRETLDAIRRPIGHTRVPLHSFFALLGRSSAMALVAEAQRSHVARRMPASDPEALPILSSVSPFKAGGRSGPGNFTNIPSGPLALRHVADMYVFPNMIAALRLTGAELHEWLERSAAVFVQIAPGARDVQLIHPDAASYNFEIIFGLHYTFDLSQPARYRPDGTLADASASRVRDLTHDGRPVADDAEFIVCTNNYRAFGAGRFAGTGPNRVMYRHRATTRDVVCRHIARGDARTAPPPTPVSFAPVADAQVLLSTGPGARAYLDEIADLHPQILDHDSDGFLTLRLDLSGPGAVAV